jgi:hypothetical protein
MKSSNMRKGLAFSGLLAVFVLALTATPVSAAPPVTVASGSFTLHASAFGGPNGVNRTFAFSVQQASDGTVSGQMQGRFFSGDVVHGNLNCLVREGNQAIVGGVATTSNDPTAVGTNFAFAIQDGPDVSSLVFTGIDSPPANPCEDLLPAVGEPDLPSFLADNGLPIATGNITIGP